MKRLYQFLIFTTCLTMILPGCVNLSAVTEFANTSNKTLATFDTVRLNYVTMYKGRAKREFLQKHNFEESPLIREREYQGFTTDSLMKANEAADKSVQLIHQVLVNYFEGLKNLSNNELMNFGGDVDKLSAALKTTGVVRVKPEEHQAYSSLTRLMVRASTDAYRRRALSRYIEEAQPSVMVLINKMDTIINLMIPMFTEEGSQSYIAYRNMVVKDKALSYSQRQMLADQYIERRHRLEARIARLRSYQAELAKIRDAHTALYKGRDKVQGKEMRAALLSYITDIEQLKADFDKLNTPPVDGKSN